MKKLLYILFTLLLLSSCTLHNSVADVGYFRFDPAQSRGVSASITYPNLLDKTWTLTAAKLDNKATTGEGTYDNVVLTDSFGPFSVGSWRFTITSADGSITGSVTTNIKAGDNTVSITVHSTATTGTLSFEDCNFLESKVGHVLYVDPYVDDNRINAPWTVANFITDDDNYFVLPTFTMNLEEGIHTIRLYYGTDSGGFSSDTISVRVVNGMVTHFTLGEQEGNMSVLVSFDQVEALV